MDEVQNVPSAEVVTPTEEKVKRGYVRTDKMEFRDIWNSSKSVAEVAEKTGKTKASCQTFASNLRKEHIMCKKFPRGKKSVK